MTEARMCVGFRAGDPDCLVDAALACPYCLHGDTHARLVLESHDPRADCVCRLCGERFVVYLEPEQALRLSLRGDR